MYYIGQVEYAYIRTYYNKEQEANFAEHMQKQ